MHKVMKTIILGMLMLPVLLSTGCAVYSESQEAMQRADRALEQAELANQRVDKLMEVYGGK